MNSRTVLFAALAGLALVGCKSAPPDHLVPLLRAVELALADGVVSAAEQAEIASYMPKPGVDWMQVLLAGGSIVGSLLGVKLLPGRVLQGPFDPKQPSQQS